MQGGCVGGPELFDLLVGQWNMIWKVQLEHQICVFKKSDTKTQHSGLWRQDFPTLETSGGNCFILGCDDLQINSRNMLFKLRSNHQKYSPARPWLAAQRLAGWHHVVLDLLKLNQIQLVFHTMLRRVGRASCGTSPFKLMNYSSLQCFNKWCSGGWRCGYTVTLLTRFENKSCYCRCCMTFVIH